MPTLTPSLRTIDLDQVGRGLLRPGQGLTASPGHRRALVTRRHPSRIGDSALAELKIERAKMHAYIHQNDCERALQATIGRELSMFSPQAHPLANLGTHWDPGVSGNCACGCYTKPADGRKEKPEQLSSVLGVLLLVECLLFSVRFAAGLYKDSASPPPSSTWTSDCGLTVTPL